MLKAVGGTFRGRAGGPGEGKRNPSSEGEEKKTREARLREEKKNPLHIFARGWNREKCFPE